MEVNEAEEVGSLLEEVQQAVLDPQRFCRTVKLKGFQPFTTAENALENVNAISEQMVTDDLKVSQRHWADTTRWNWSSQDRHGSGRVGCRSASQGNASWRWRLAKEVLPEAGSPSLSNTVVQYASTGAPLHADGDEHYSSWRGTRPIFRS